MTSDFLFIKHVVQQNLMKEGTVGTKQKTHPFTNLMHKLI
jgi:hypothetical protein